MSLHQCPGMLSSSSNPPDSDSIYAHSSSVSSVELSPEPIKHRKHKNQRSDSPEPSKLRKRKRKHSNHEEDLESKPHSKVKSSKRPSHRGGTSKEKGNTTPHEQCLHFSRWIPQGVDMFCILKDVFRLAPLIEEARNYNPDDDEDDRKVLDNVLAHISKDGCDQILWTYEKILKSDELHEILDEADAIPNRTDDKPLKPAIFPESKGSRAKMGFNHPDLALMLCPVKYLAGYQKEPSVTKAKLECGELKMDARAWPALLYKGKVAGEAFNPKNIQDGLFEGYLLERVMKHVLTGPSSAFGGDDFHVPNSCNVSLHGMTSIEAENIAYAAVVARSAISSRDKWSVDDGTYSYRKAYYRTIDIICNPPDEVWAKAIIQHYNLKLFKDKGGRGAGLLNSATSDAGEDDEDDDIAVMCKQFALQSANPPPAPPSPKPEVLPVEHCDLGFDNQNLDAVGNIHDSTLPPRFRSPKVTSPPASPSPLPPTPRVHTIPRACPAQHKANPHPQSPVPPTPVLQHSPSPLPPTRTPRAHTIPRAHPVQHKANSRPGSPAPPPALCTPLPRKKQKHVQPDSPLTESEASHEEVDAPI
ncbi:uncharacterized protein EDB91DRAFT_1251671 [Suillus paluster]|uniref:uncharacterized protein n=1 Tax=Suillus paluster TaxID=48578 RepID=UPI001B87A487|nr:uncharacterized protein EDB91DRAFT_1251671 [Suillus paluster]KAG1732623.1 hypothetical protein EDB91DRAFT_1251671 [Suillus paluster]